MVNARLRETARLAFFFASPGHFNFVNCETETSKCSNPSARLSDSILAAEFKQRTSPSRGFCVVFFDAPFSFLISFCELAGTGNSTLKLVMIY